MELDLLTRRYFIIQKFSIMKQEWTVIEADEEEYTGHPLPFADWVNLSRPLIIAEKGNTHWQ